MPKYRLLTTEELKTFEKEFIDYLAVNTITGEDWVKMKAESPEKAEGIVDVFSDVVMEGVLRNIEFLELRTKDQLMAFQCLPDKILLAGMKSDDPAADFTSPEFIKNGLAAPPKGLRIFSSDKEYDKTREQELFEMTEAGCLVSDGKIFKALSMAIAGSKTGDLP